MLFPLFLDNYTYTFYCTIFFSDCINFTAELPTLTGMPTNEANAEIKTQPDSRQGSQPTHEMKFPDNTLISLII